MKIQLFTEKDLPCLDDLKPEGWGDIKSPHEYYLSKSFCRTVKIEINGRPVGIGTTIKHRHSAWLAHIIVHEKYRGQGIGGQIVSDSISFLQEDPHIRTVSLIATDQGYPVYKKAGFIEQTRYFFYEKQSGVEIVDPQSSCFIPFENYMESEILQMDMMVSGENRQRVIQDKLPGTIVYMNNNRIEGFYIPHFGDGLIIAENESAGIELLKLKISNSDRVVIPRLNKAARNFLIESGFKETIKARRMIYGPAFTWKPECLFSRIGGKLG